MTTPPVFPMLSGQGWSVHKRPSFSTRVASHVSGREVRAPFYAQTLYEFELTFDGLASNAAYPGLGTNSLQSLMGLYLQVQGQFGTFLFTDPTDNSVTAQPIANGDGTTTVFTLVRTLGGATEPASFVTTLSNVYFNGVNQTSSGFALTQPNTLTFTNPPPAGSTSPAQKLAEDSSNGYHYTFQFAASQPSGTSITFKVYVQAVERTSCYLQIFDSVGFKSVDFNLATGAVGTVGPGVTAASITGVGGGWYQLSITVPMAATAPPLFEIFLENPLGTNFYTGTAGNGIYISGANWSAGLGAAAFLPAWSSVSGSTISSAAVTLPGPVAITATFAYAFNCRFLDDQEDFENFMNGLWMVQSLKFRSVKP